MTDSISNTAMSRKLSAGFFIAALPLVLGACGPATDEPELVDVDPYEAATEDAPEIEDALRDTDTIVEEEAIDPSSADRLGDVEITRYAEAIIRPVNGSRVGGNVLLRDERGTVYFSGQVSGLTAGKHGLHIHSTGDCSVPDESSAEGHFAPDDDPHGSPPEPDGRHHAGDLGNIIANDEGIADIRIEDAELSLDTGKYTVVGRALIVHADADDLASQPSGGAGNRIGCGIIKIKPGPAYQL